MDIVIDAGCGNGDGTAILSSKARKVIGIDKYKKIIKFAMEHNKKDNNYFMMNNLDQMEMFPQCDITVAINVIEELRFQTSFISKVQDSTRKRIIIVTPLDISEMVKHVSWECITSMSITNCPDIFSVYERKYN
jgi:2-polyprenyl-3-methyl-5-hydroxy-6-metoxy-1,4-benzoquinol methylase